MPEFDDLWEKRWNSLCEGIESRVEEIDKRLVDAPDLDEYDRQKISATRKVLIRLCYFTKKIFPYFQNGNIDFAPDYSREHVLSTILDQVGYDLETLSRVAHDQFTIGGKNILRKADLLAEEALKLATKLEFLDDSSVVLSYFQKSFSVRIIPYAKVLMLGIPFSARTVAQDFLAIPHEVGHYVYWKGVSPDGDTIKEKISKKLADNHTKTSWVPRWSEELFADVYGAYVGGPFIALSFQDLGLQNLPNDIVEDDEDHPTPVLRPYVYAKALNKAGFSESAELLYVLWKRRLVEYRKVRDPIKRTDRKDRNFDNIYLGNGNPYPVLTTNTNGEVVLGAMKEGVDLGEEEPVDSVIREISELLGRVPNNDLGAWREMMHEIEDVLAQEIDPDGEDILDEKKKRVKNNAKAFLSEEWKNHSEDEKKTKLKDVQDSLNELFKIFLESVPDRDQVGDSFNVTMPDGNLEVALSQEFQELIETWEARGLKNKSKRVWLRVWEAGGWTTEGPECDASSGSC